MGPTRRLAALWGLPLLSAMAVLTAGCGASAPAGAPPSEVPVAGGREPIQVDLDTIFPPGPGRDLVLNNCQNCHMWTPIVVLQMDRDGWYRNSLEHRERVDGLTDEEFRILYDYLSSTFTPDRPVPKLPPEVLEAWTSF